MNDNLTSITAVGTATPDHVYPLSDFLSWAGETHPNPTAKRKLGFIAKDAGIDTKHMALSDFSSVGQGVLYSSNGAGYQDPTTTERLEQYLPLAVSLGAKAAFHCLGRRSLDPGDVTHLITVSCTGLQAPGLEIALSKTLHLSAQCERFAVNFMGCYAAFHAMKIADYICRGSTDAKVLVVSVELCSLHFRNSVDNDNLLSTVLFSDGAAAVLLERKTTISGPQLVCKGFSSVLIPEGEKAMGWSVGNRGFEMILSNSVPGFIRGHVLEAFEALLAKHGVHRGQLNSFAIHPGGKNILRAFEEAIGCTAKDLYISYEVMRHHGNMSSATILFVLEQVLYSETPSGYCYSAAFGPGLTVESGLFYLA